MAIDADGKMVGQLIMEVHKRKVILLGRGKEMSLSRFLGSYYKLSDLYAVY